MQRQSLHGVSTLVPDDEESQIFAGSPNGVSLGSIPTLSTTTTEKQPLKTFNGGSGSPTKQHLVVDYSTKILFCLSLTSLLLMLCLTIMSASTSTTSSNKSGASIANIQHVGELISLDESYTRSKVFPITYLDVDFSKPSNLGLNRVRGICKIYLSTYFTFNFNHENQRASYNPPTVIGADDVNETPYTHWKKIERTLQFLSGDESNYISDNDIIVFSDSTDVFFINSVETIREVYQNYYIKELSKIDLQADVDKDWPLVFIAEKNKWPPNDYIQNMFAKTPEELKMVENHYFNKDGYHVYRNCERSTQRIYLNSGLYVGRKRDIRKALTIGVNLKRSEPKERLGDQSVYQFIYTTKKFPILMDCEYRMFFSPFSVCNTVVNDPNSKWGCSISEDGRPTPKTVIALHSNGGFCPTLCNCFKSMKNMGSFKKLLSQSKSTMSFKSYNINSKQVTNVLMDYACGRFVDESFPDKSCNVQPGR